MHILILGGTVFVGRVLVVEALARGHKVTVFNRGNNPPIQGATTIVGDRRASNGYSGLNGLRFDAVIDTWGEEPQGVTSAVEALRGRFNHYTYISTVMVYDRDVFEPSRLYTEDETSLFNTDGPDAAKQSPYQYNKRGGEIAASVCDTPVFVPRPGIILGPHEHVVGTGGRLPWWLPRFQRGGRVVAPGPPDLTTNFIDVRDLASFVLGGVEKQLSGAYNVLGGPEAAPMRQLLEKFNEVTGSHAQLVWKTPEEVLALDNFNFIAELPLWCPPGSKEYGMLNLWDTSKARAAGLVTRPAVQTVGDTWDWMQSAEYEPREIPADSSFVYGLSPENEAKLLGETYGPSSENEAELPGEIDGMSSENETKLLEEVDGTSPDSKRQ